jgi:hypothetical protein
MEPILFYLQFFGILSIPGLTAILLFKKKIFKTVRATYYFTPIVLAILLIGNHFLFYIEPKEPYCGFPPVINIPLVIIISTLFSTFIQSLLNRLFKVNNKRKTTFEQQ